MPAKDTYEINVLLTELQQKLPPWLDPRQRHPEKYDAIRNKHRVRWIAEKDRQQARRLTNGAAPHAAWSGP
jgi:hypothetical protein